MATLDSIEVRWFAENVSHPTRAELEQRMSVLKDKGIDVDTRPDIYVRVPGALDFGLKVRGLGKHQNDRATIARLEFKGRTHSLGTQVFARSVVGKVECWTKWSYESPAPMNLFASGDGIELRKTRCQVKYRWNEKFKLERLKSAKEMVTKGGAFEITLVEKGDRSFWTIGVEAFPADAETISRFPEFVAVGVDFLVAEKLDDIISPSALDERRSQSYPAWLADL